MAESGKLPVFSPTKRGEAPGSRTAVREKAAREAARSLMENPSQPLAELKRGISSKHSIAFLKNSEISKLIPSSSKWSSLRRKLLKSPTRTLSGVSPIALMPPPYPCVGKCIYCPRGENAPQSYNGYEPTTIRAIECGYSARKQVLTRLSQYDGQGHSTDKCHLIIMGGTFLCAPKALRRSFVKEAFDALNGNRSRTIRSAIDANESAPHRAIGVTFETRPDYAMAREADEMLTLGGTQVELGVQSLSDAVYRKVHRGHTVEDVALSTQILKESGFKVCYHMMPGLFCTPAQDVSYFRRLFKDERFQPDMLKIYPALVLRGTGLYSLWKAGKYRPYDTEQAAEVIARATKYVPPYVRVQRIQRDIPSPLVEAGVKHSNLRQIVDRLLAESGEKCHCIRCREIGSEERKGGKASKLSLSLGRIDYRASGGKEIFLSFEDSEKELLAGFLRLRIPHAPHRSELANSAIVRELHVYGQEASIGERSELKTQHTGLGSKLLREAEDITKNEFGLDKIAVISGPGARGYYRKYGYLLDGPYMHKKI
jgi:elongator complex protein 3